MQNQKIEIRDISKRIDIGSQRRFSTNTLSR